MFGGGGGNCIICRKMGVEWKKKGGETKNFLKRGGAVTPLRTMIHLIRTKLVVVFCT